MASRTKSVVSFTEFQHNLQHQNDANPPHEPSSPVHNNIRRFSRRLSTFSTTSISSAFDKHISSAAYQYDTTDTNEPASYSQNDADVFHRTNEILYEEEQQEAEVRELGTVSGGGDVKKLGPLSAVNVQSDEQSQRSTYFLLGLLCLANFCLAMNSSLTAPFFPTEVMSKSGNAFLAGAVISTFEATRFILTPIYGNYVYAIGPRFMLLAGPFICASCSIIFGLNGMSPSGATFFALAACVRIVAGAGSSMYNIASVTAKPMLFKGGARLAFPLLRAAVTLGVVVGPAVGGALYSIGGFSLPFWVLGGCVMCISVVQIRIIPDLTALERAHKQAAAAVQCETTTKAKRRMSVESAQEKTNGVGDTMEANFVNVFTNPAVAFCLLMSWAFGLVITFFTTNITMHVKPLVGSAANIGYIILIAGVAEVCVSPFVSTALDRGAPARLTVVIGFAMCSIGLLLVGPTPLIPWLKTSVWLVIVGTVIYGMGIGFGFTAPYNLAVKAARSQGFPPTQQTSGLIAGCMSTAFTCGCFLGPLTGGAMHDKLGFPWSATIVAGGLCVIMLVSIANSMVYVFRWHRRRRRVDVVVVARNV